MVKQKIITEKIIFDDFLSYYSNSKLAYIITVINSLLYNKNRNFKLKNNRKIEEREIFDKLKFYYNSNSISVFNEFINNFKNSAFIEKAEDGFVTIKSKRKIYEICKQDFYQRIGSKGVLTLNRTIIDIDKLNLIDIDKFTYNGYQKIKTQIEFRKPFMSGYLNEEDNIPYYNCFTIAKQLNVSISTVSNHIKNLEKYFNFELVKKKYEYFDKFEMKKYQDEIGGFFHIVKDTNQAKEEIWYLYKLKGMLIPNQNIFKFQNGSLINIEKSKYKKLDKTIRVYKQGRIKNYSAGIVDFDWYQEHKQRILNSKPKNKKQKPKRYKLILNSNQKGFVFSNDRTNFSKPNPEVASINVKSLNLNESLKMLQSKEICKIFNTNKKKTVMTELKSFVSKIKRYFILRNQECCNSYKISSDKTIYFESFSCNIDSYKLIINYLDHLYSNLRNKNIIEFDKEKILMNVFYFLNPIIDYGYIFNELQINNYSQLIQKMVYSKLNLLEIIIKNLELNEINFYSVKVDELHYSDIEALKKTLLEKCKFLEVLHFKKKIIEKKPFTLKQVIKSDNYSYLYTTVKRNEHKMIYKSTV